MESERHFGQLISLISQDTTDITVASISGQCSHTKTFTQSNIFELGNKERQKLMHYLWYTVVYGLHQSVRQQNC